jgi:hypothetical protein
MNNNTLFVREKDGYYSISFQEATPEDRILYFYCLHKDLKLEEIMTGELKVPPRGETRREAVGNLMIKYRSGRNRPELYIDVSEFDWSISLAAIPSKEQFRTAVLERDKDEYWTTPALMAEYRSKSPRVVKSDEVKILENSYPSMSDKETIIAPLHEVVVIKFKTREAELKKKEILIAFTNPVEKHPTKLNGKIYQWRSIERINGDKYRLISEGTNELYEGDFTNKKPEGHKLEDYKMTIDIDGLRLPWSFSSEDEAGYIYYDDKRIIIEITEFGTVDEYLKDLEQIEWNLPKE